MIFKHKNRAAGGSEYAGADDFETIFTDEMDRLYEVALLITADLAKAEQVFVRALESCLSANHVFKPWARSWAKRAVILSAVATISPRPEPDSWLQLPISIEMSPSQTELASVLGLPDFERSVFVMNVLERFSARECALLLGSTLRDVREARDRALRVIVPPHSFELETDVLLAQEEVA